MKFVDAHIHLSDEEYAGVVSEVLTEAKNSGVVALVSNSIDLKTCQGTLEVTERHPGMVYAALGIHPWTVKGLKEDELNQVLQLISAQRGNRAFVALGEIGLDSKYMEIWDKQVKVFDLMLRLAEKLGLPAIIHSRGTTVQIVDMLPSYKLKKVLLHWFSNPISALVKAVERGYYITEGPPAAYSDGIRDVVKMVPLTNLLTETDGPVRFFKKPFEGKRTTPAFIPNVIAAFAEVKNMSAEEVAEQILRNFQDFFDVKLE
ncbi:MAG: TatD family hydrolase [Candidatus Bathyarchaeia archaeon]|jgi:TatD DNase family protein